MKARRLISGATFGPATLKVIGQAFDQAWAEAKDNFTTPEEKAAARLCIAEGILANARENSRDMDELRVAGRGRRCVGRWADRRWHELTGRLRVVTV
jgi:hypothetical protein